MAKWWEKKINDGLQSKSDDADETREIEKFNEAASRIYKALPKSERRAFVDLLSATRELHCIESFKGFFMGHKEGHNASRLIALPDGQHLHLIDGKTYLIQDVPTGGASNVQ